MIYNIINIYISLYFLVCAIYYLSIYIHEKIKVNLLLGFISIIMFISIYNNNIALPIYLEIPFCIVFVAGTIKMIMNIKKYIINKKVI